MDGKDGKTVRSDSVIYRLTSPCGKTGGTTNPEFPNSRYIRDVGSVVGNAVNSVPETIKESSCVGNVGSTTNWL